MPSVLAEPQFWLFAVPSLMILGLGKGGFVGSGVLGMPLLAQVLPPVTAAAVLLPVLIVQDLVALFYFRGSVEWRAIRPLLAGALIGIAAATLFASRTSPGLVKTLVGVVGLVFALNWFFPFAQRLQERKPPGLFSAIFWGGVSGFTSFVAHAGGPPYQVHALPQRFPRDVLVGTTMMFFTIINLVKAPPYFWLGQFTRDNLIVSAALAPIAIATTILGVWLVRKAPLEPFYRIIYIALLLVSCKLIFDGIWRD